MKGCKSFKLFNLQPFVTGTWQYCSRPEVKHDSWFSCICYLLRKFCNSLAFTTLSYKHAVMHYTPINSEMGNSAFKQHATCKRISHITRCNKPIILKLLIPCHVYITFMLEYMYIENFCWVMSFIWHSLPKSLMQYVTNSITMPKVLRSTKLLCWNPLYAQV